MSVELSEAMVLYLAEKLHDRLNAQPSTPTVDEIAAILRPDPKQIIPLGALHLDRFMSREEMAEAWVKASEEIYGTHTRAG